MTKNTEFKALLYARVSQEVQAEGNSVSIEQQLAEMRSLCEKKEWQITNEYIDTQNYLATQMPHKGKIVNPSGERADRPAFLEMLEAIKTGNYDIILCWRDDRLVRHPRVDVALEDALDEGDALRCGKEKIQLFDATGMEINRFLLNIVSGIWRQESKRRSERTRMGKFSTLMEGHWCGEFRRYGYKSVKVLGKRGREIELDPITAPIIKQIYEMYDGGYRIVDIRSYLIENEVPQIYTVLVKHKWSRPLIDRILHSEEYLGEATWRFADGVVINVKIPPIIEPDLWKRVQERFERNRRLSPRNAKGVYPLQGLLYCGECGHLLSVSKMHAYGSYQFGEGDSHAYRCHISSHNPHENHPKPACFNGTKMDWVIWRFVVDEILPSPQNAIVLVKTQVDILNMHGDSAEGEIAQIEKRLQDIHNERSFYQKKAGQGKIEESEFDQRMDETASEVEILNSRLDYLLKLRHNTELVQRSLDYVKVVFSKLSEKASLVDISPEKFIEMPDEQKREILKGKRAILRIIIENAFVFSTQQVKLFCKVDGSEISSLGIPSC